LSIWLSLVVGVVDLLEEVEVLVDSELVLG
jgi:hypothetical protein